MHQNDRAVLFTFIISNAFINEHLSYKMLSYRRETALQGAL